MHDRPGPVLRGTYSAWKASALELGSESAPGNLCSGRHGRARPSPPDPERRWPAKPCWPILRSRSHAAPLAVVTDRAGEDLTAACAGPSWPLPLPPNQPGDRTDDGSRFPCPRASSTGCLSFLAPKATSPLGSDLCREGKKKDLTHHRIFAAGERRDVAQNGAGDRIFSVASTGHRTPWPTRSVAERRALEDKELGSALEPTFQIRAIWVFGQADRRVCAPRRAWLQASELDELDVAGPTAHISASRRWAATKRSAVEHAVGASVIPVFATASAVRRASAIAVYIAQRTGLQDSFWVVLRQLSVLRSNALSTGWVGVSALAGTAVGIVLGALLILAISVSKIRSWAVLPVADPLCGLRASGDRRGRPG